MKPRQMIGFQLATIPASSKEELFATYARLIDELELQAIEILLERVADRHWFDIEEAPPPQLQQLLSKLQRRGAHLPFLYVNPVAPEPAIRRASIAVLKNAIDYAVSCGVDYVIMHCRGRNYFLPEQELTQLWCETLIEISEYAEKRQVFLCVENADYLIDLKKISLTINSLNNTRLGITLDIGHSYFRPANPRWRYIALNLLDYYSPWWLFKHLFAHSSYGTLAEFVLRESSRLNNLHLHDHNGKTDHLPPGKGRLDFSFLRYIPPQVALIIEARFNSLQEVYDSYKYVKRHLAKPLEEQELDSLRLSAVRE